MVRGLSSFIGEGAGGALPSIGWTLKEFEEFINKADTDTAYEAFIKRKKAMQDGNLPSSSGEKRPAADDSNARKRAKVSNGYEGSSVNFTPGLSPQNFGSPYSPDPSMNLFSSIRPPPNYNSNFLNGLTDSSGTTNSFLSGVPSGLGYTSSSGRDSFNAPYPSGGNTPSQGSASASSLQTSTYMPMPTSTIQPSQTSGGSGSANDDPLEDPKAQEAGKLIG